MNVIRARAQRGLGQAASREFTLFDAIVSMAAIGLTLALARSHLTYLWANLRTIPYPGPAGWAGIWAYLRTRTDVSGSILMLSFTSLECLLVCWTLAFFIMRLRQPRPPLRVLVRQPGMVDLRGVAPRYVPRDLHLYVRGSTTPWLGRRCLDRLCDPRCLDHTGTARGLETEPSWIDRLGRVLGVCWAVVIPLQAVFMHFSA